MLNAVAVNSYGQEVKLDTSNYYPGDHDFNLIVAADKGYTTEVVRLINKGADVNSRTNDGVTPLMYAVQQENKEIVEFLFLKGAYPNLMPDNGIPTLITAVKTENFDITEILIRNGANINKGDPQGITALMYAAAFNNFVLCDMLIYYEAWVNLKDNKGNSSLLVASYYGNKDIVKLLIDNKAEINLADKYGNTPLHVASQNGYMDIVQILLENGANINEQNKGGYTPLTLAIKSNNSKLVEYLLKEGADPNVELSLNTFPMNVAMKTKNDTLKRLLEEYDAELNRKPVFNMISLDLGFNFSGKDAMFGGALGLYDSRYKFAIKAGGNIRLKAKPVLIQNKANEYYQLMERRSMLYLSLSRDFKLYQDSDVSYIFTPSLGSALTYGSYKGITRRPDNKFIPLPGAEISIMSQYVGLGVNYYYVDFDVTGINDHRIGFNLKFLIPTKNYKKSTKKVLWYL